VKKSLGLEILWWLQTAGLEWSVFVAQAKELGNLISFV